MEYRKYVPADIRYKLWFLYFIFNISPINSTLFFLASFLIDVDHYLYYIYRKKDFSLRKAFNWFIKMDAKYLSLSKKQREKYDFSFCIFHGVESVALLAILSLIPGLSFLVFIAAGFLLHLLLDTVHLIYVKINPLVVLSLLYKIHFSQGKKR